MRSHILPIPWLELLIMRLWPVVFSLVWITKASSLAWLLNYRSQQINQFKRSTTAIMNLSYVENLWYHLRYYQIRLWPLESRSKVRNMAIWLFPPEDCFKQMQKQLTQQQIRNPRWSITIYVLPMYYRLPSISPDSTLCPGVLLYVPIYVQSLSQRKEKKRLRW
jgi:hypothetical protein